MGKTLEKDYQVPGAGGRKDRKQTVINKGAKKWQFTMRQKCRPDMMLIFASFEANNVSHAMRR